MAAGHAQMVFESYCYGPVDVIKMRKGDSTLWLSLQDSAGRRAEAIYRGCVYWRLEPEEPHLSLVQRLSAKQLQQMAPVTMQELQKNTSHVPKLLKEWEEDGLSFYLHLGSQPDSEYLVVARSLQYSETE